MLRGGEMVIGLIAYLKKAKEENNPKKPNNQ